MRKLREIIGLPVLTYETGRKVEDVDDILLDPEENCILALLVDRGGWFDGARVVPFSNVKSIGDDAIIIQNERSIIRADEDLKIKEAMDSNRVIARMRVYSSDGDYLGRVDDMVVDEDTGKIVGYQVTGGLVQETLRGKKFVRAPEAAAVGEEILFVPPEARERMEREVTGGVQKAAEEARARGEQVAGEAREKGGEAMGRAREDMMRASTEQQKKFVVGRQSDRTVVARDGTVLVHAGDVISGPIAEEAERAGVLNDLVMAAGAGMAAAGGAGLGATAGRVREEAGGTFERLREEAGEAVEDVRRTFEDLTTRAQKRTEEERIKAALGRPVTRVILDHNDNVILNTGEIVTNSAIERARRAGVLDVLLGSVSTEKPQFTKEELKAPRPGEERIEGFGAGERRPPPSREGGLEDIGDE